MKQQGDFIILKDFILRVSALDCVFKDPECKDGTYKIQYYLRGNATPLYFTFDKKEHQDIAYDLILKAMTNQGV